MHNTRLRPWVIIIFTIICLIGIIYYSYKILLWYNHIQDNKKILKKTKESIVIHKENGINKYDIDFNELKKLNPDTIAYIKVNNTNINYIVVKGKDNKYYLNHNFEKKYNVAGWVFGDYRNNFDETDKNIIIYGHNTKDGSMFDSLINVLTEKWQKNKDNYDIVLVTENGLYHYHVFSTYSIIPEDYYIKTNFNNDNFKDFINKLKSRSIYDYNIEVDENDKILTLSSCIGDGKKRVVLHAKLIKKEKKE